MSPILGGRGIGVRAYGFGGAGAPSQVTGLSATNVGSGRAYNDGRIDLSWTAPANNGAPITGYKIERSTDNSTFTTLVADTGSTSTTYSNTSLASAQIYYYKVSAINTVGTGLASASTSATATTVPQTPTITSATRTGNTTVSIAFTGATGGAVLTAVTATSSPSVSISSSGTSSPMTATATYVQGTSYTFTITATNANGTSSASAASNAVIPFGLPTVQTWSSSTNYPVANNAVYAVGNNSYVVSAGGENSSGNPTNASYYWNGSAWTSTTLIDSVRYSTMATNNQGYFYSIGGYSAGGFNGSTRWKSNGTASWQYGSGTPANSAEDASAGLGSGVIFFSNGVANTYWLPSPSGGYSSTGYNPPTTNMQAGASSTDYSKVFMSRGGEYNFYSTTNQASAWATETNMPAIFTSGCTLTSSQNAIFMSGGNFNSNTYRYSGTTWATQTASPVYFAVGRAGGVRSNVWSLFANRQNGTERSQGHYVATIS